MPLFGKQEQSKQNYLRGKEKAEMDKKAKCQQEINAILEKYGLVIRARFELVGMPEQPKQIKEI